MTYNKKVSIMAFSIMTFSLLILNVMAFSIMTFSLLILNVMAFSTMTFTIKTISIAIKMGHCASVSFSLNDTQYRLYSISMKIIFFHHKKDLF
jgi:hypothetical protein